MGFRKQMMIPLDGGGAPTPPMDYQQALQKLIEQRKAAQASPDAMAANDFQNSLGILLNQLMKSQASMGNIGGKPTESTGVDFQDYGKAAFEQMKQQNSLANQNFEQGLQQQQAGMQADKFAQDQTQQAAQLQKQPEIERRAEEDRLLKNKLTSSQIRENEAKALEYINKAKNNTLTPEEGKDFKEIRANERMRENLKLGLYDKDPVLKSSVEKTLQEADAKFIKNTAFTQTPAQLKVSTRKTLVDNLNRSLNQLEGIITKRGTMAFTGPAGLEMDKYLNFIAADTAKLKDPTSVAMPGEVEVARADLPIRNYLGASMTNATALKLIKSYREDIKQRAASFDKYDLEGGRPSAPTSPTSAASSTPAETKIIGGRPSAPTSPTSAASSTPAETKIIGGVEYIRGWRKK